MTDERASQISVVCTGCRKRVVKNFSGDFGSSKAMRQISSEGWLRREFGPNASPWFCSTNCAYHSDEALEIEKHWERGSIPKWIPAIFFIVSMFVLLFILWRYL